MGTISPTRVETAHLTREQLIDGLFFTRDHLVIPGHTRERPQFKSLVVVEKPHAQYTDDDLRQLLAFSRRHTEKYKRSCGDLDHHSNFIVIRRNQHGSWSGKRWTWDRENEQHRRTLDELLAIFDAE